ncbi:hypothetical protein INT47_011669 [Mucor saturninus]|uniref:Uncharacterized protein n=1 Tax=Mucor saturninus TaxID=64648 RepID=A0A8H7QLA0_9FUNG|nr:hypothetical protein INT47_011669 [Mucor saturninus]
MAKNSAWIWKRVKRTIPPPHILYTGLYNLFLSFGSLKCVKSGLPLFDKVSWKSAVNVLVAVKDGHVSDPPDLSLYHVRGKDRDGLTLYRCVRGTNSLEGGVH